MTGSERWNEEIRFSNSADSWWETAREQLENELFEKLGRDPSQQEIEEHCSEERIIDRIAYLLENAA